MQLKNPDFRVSVEELSSFNLLEMISHSYKGLTSGDRPRMSFFFWEIPKVEKAWIFYQGTTSYTNFFDGLSRILRWSNGHGALDEIKGVCIRGLRAWQKKGVAISQMGALPVSLYTGEAFDNNVAVIIPDDPKIITAIFSYLSSSEYTIAVRRIDQQIKVTNATLGKVLFDLERWEKLACKSYPNGLPKPYSNDPTQWIFHGHPCASTRWDDEKKCVSMGPARIDISVLSTAVIRLMGYRWPAELDTHMELADEQRNLISQTKELYKFANIRGIMCVPPVRGEPAAEILLREILEASYGNEWSAEIEAELLHNSEFSGRTFENWLRDGFFSQHISQFKQRPFIWQFWDGLRDGFSALVNYHKLDHNLLETLTHTYLGDWIRRQKNDLKNQVDGAGVKLVAAESLKSRLEMILNGEAPYDIFVRWKSLKDQPVGWNPDLQDGVRINIRPFMMPPDIGRKGSGILRYPPNINWGIDRGAETRSSPWYHLHRGQRINDVHLTLEEKRAAHNKK
jgi:hypothetical protein